MISNQDQSCHVTPLVDGLALWESQSHSPTCLLSLIRLDGTERLLLPFTHQMAVVHVHYIDAELVRSYVHCNGKECLFCRVGYGKTERNLWPLYDLVDRAVGVLAITPNMRPESLRPQLLPVMRRSKEGEERLLLSISSPDKFRFAVSCCPLPAGTDDGTAQIADFVAKLNACEIDIGSVYLRIANEDIPSIPELATRLALKGIKAA